MQPMEVLYLKQVECSKEEWKVAIGLKSTRMFVSMFGYAQRTAKRNREPPTLLLTDPSNPHINWLISSMTVVVFFPLSSLKSVVAK